MEPHSIECSKINRLWESLIRSGKHPEINLSLGATRDIKIHEVVIRNA